MDSITQAVLGAAMGEAVLGKKIGNKAILIGALAGTIPDLDVLSRLFIDDQIYGLLYHRGITHSILFTFLASPLFAWLTLLYYQKGTHKSKVTQGIIGGFLGLLYLAVLAGVGALMFNFFNLGTSIVFFSVLALGYPIFKTLISNTLHPPKRDSPATFKDWTLLYFLGFLTHWIIDTCTAYGTQIFEPFSNARITFSNISIVDPLYTVPMIIGLLGAFFAARTVKRRQWNLMGIAVATLYMASTFYTKSIMNKVVEENLAAQGIEAIGYTTYPSIFNSVLWQTTIMTKDNYYYGNYSLLDEDNKMEFIKLPKNHTLLDKYADNESVKILLWFANDYYNVIENEDGSMVFNNLRFGLLGTSKKSNIPVEDRYIFKFYLVEKDGVLKAEENRDMGKIDISDMAATFWKRILGDKNA